MVYIEINKKNYNKGNPSPIEQLNKYLSDKSKKIFILIFMEGCGPCNQTRPEWSKLKNVISKNANNIIIVSIDKDLVSKVNNLQEANSFPTIRYVTNTGKIVENYEDSNISKKDRTIESFVEWIKVKSGDNNITKSEEKSFTKNNRKINSSTKKNRKQRGGKWSAKYKRSINCNRPKGFSQRQYCKYSRNK